MASAPWEKKARPSPSLARPFLRTQKNATHIAISAKSTAIGTKMAAAFPGLHDRLEHSTSELVIMLPEVVEAEKLDDDAEAPNPPRDVEIGNDVDESAVPKTPLVAEPDADESPTLAMTDGLLVDERMDVDVVVESEL